MATTGSVLEGLRAYLAQQASDEGLLEVPVTVLARPLSAEEAIGRPEHSDYPLIVGRERMMEATVRGARGQAFTDLYGTWEGLLKDVLALPLFGSFHRAVFVATLNATMRGLGELEDTIHCKDADPVHCGTRLRDLVHDESLESPFVLIGYQPRLAEALSALGELRIVDMDVRHIGQIRADAQVLSPSETDRALAGSCTVFVTGTSLVNGTIDRFLDLPMTTVFYGVTIAGPAKLLGIRRFCPCGR